jgi:hypothetical protein
LYVDIVQFLNIFGGSIYFDKSQNGYYKWQVQSENNLQFFMDYVKLCPPQSINRNRLLLVKDYYRLVNLKAHKAPKDTKLHKA